MCRDNLLRADSCPVDDGANCCYIDCFAAPGGRMLVAAFYIDDFSETLKWLIVPVLNRFLGE